MRTPFRTWPLVLCLALLPTLALPAQAPSLPLLQPADTLHKKRVWVSATAGGAIYGGVSVALWNAWYKDFPLTSFHTFNDWGEWLDVDKAGHLFSAYIQSQYSYQGARWAGISPRHARWIAVAVGTGLQATIEIMDGFSEKWGFSWGDIAFNTAGVGLFAAQDLLWQEQRLLMKVSSSPKSYPEYRVPPLDQGESLLLQERADELFGTSATERFLKDYNAQTIWLSANLWSFLPDRQNSRFPRWLNLALGYGAENLFGGFENSWTRDDATYTLDPQRFPRYRQFYLALDVDLRKIPVKRRWQRFALGLLNWVKVPAPALEITSRGRLRFHALQF